MSRNRGPCKHKHGIARFFNVASFSVLPVYDPATRKLYHFIATGTRLEDHHYRGLQDTQECNTNNDAASQSEITVDHAPAATEFDENQIPEFSENLNDRDDGDDDDDYDKEEVEMAWSEHLEDLAEMKRRIDTRPQVRKAFLESYKKKYHKAVNGNDNTLSRKLYDFGVEKKRKNAYIIPVGAPSIARRSKKNRGREVSNMGRPYKQHTRKTQMFVDSEGDGDIYHSIPTSTRRQGRQPHNLSAAIEANKPNAKKH